MNGERRCPSPPKYLYGLAVVLDARLDSAFGTMELFFDQAGRYKQTVRYGGTVSHRDTENRRHRGNVVNGKMMSEPTYLV